MGSTAWERALATGFQVGAQLERVLGGSRWPAGGTLARETRSAGRTDRAAGRLEQSQDPATDVVADVPLMTAVQDT